MTVEPMPAFDTFVERVESDPGDYAILAASRLGLEMAAAYLVNRSHAESVNFGTGKAEFANGSRIHLVVPDPAFIRLRGLRLRGALLVHGDRPLPPELHAYLPTLAFGVDFTIDTVSW